MNILNSSNQQQSDGSLTPTRRNVYKYVYELPYQERKEICSLLDINSGWKDVGALMGYPNIKLEEFGLSIHRPGGSPTDSLLTDWSNKNHTILELFIVLAKEENYRAMEVISRFVDQKYHKFIVKEDVHATQELYNLQKKQEVVSVQNVQTPVTKEEKVTAKVESIWPKDPSEKDVEGVGFLPEIPYEELLQATDNWSTRNILGKGGFGTVFKGVWKNTLVAIKRMEQRSNRVFPDSELKQSLVELRSLNFYRHDNILPIYGYYLKGDGGYPCLIYQYMANGSLEDRLLCKQKTLPLSWIRRYMIIRGVACGIQFLHSMRPDKPLIHGDIKSANILLDKNLDPKIGDFGLTRALDKIATGASYVKVSRAHGTRPYLPDEYLRSKKLSVKLDTYSYGIMLLEVASGQRAYDEKRSTKLLKDYLEEMDGSSELIKDSKGGSEYGEIFSIMINVARSCTARLPKDRPKMEDVLRYLDTNMSTVPATSQQGAVRSFQVSGGAPHASEVSGLRPASFNIPISPSNLHRTREIRSTSPHFGGVHMLASNVSTNKGVISAIPEPSVSNQRRSPVLHPPSPSTNRWSPVGSLGRPAEEIQNEASNVPALLEPSSSIPPRIVEPEVAVPSFVPPAHAMKSTILEGNEDQYSDTIPIPLITQLGIKEHETDS